MRTCYNCIYIEVRATPEGIDSCANPDGEGYGKIDFDPHEDDANCDCFVWDEDPATEDFGGNGSSN